MAINVIEFEFYLRRFIAKSREGNILISNFKALAEAVNRGGTGGGSGTGAPGNSIFSGNNDPTDSNTNGSPIDGDVYIQTSGDGAIWQRVNGNWIKIINRIVGANGTAGVDGQDGTDGVDGEGLPTGGTVGQIPEKASGTDYDIRWTNPPTSGTAGDAFAGLFSSDNVGVSNHDGVRWNNDYRGTDGITFSQVRDGFSLPPGKYILEAFLTQVSSLQSEYEWFYDNVSIGHQGSSAHSVARFPDTVIALITVADSGHTIQLRPTSNGHSESNSVTVLVTTHTGATGPRGERGLQGDAGQQGQQGNPGQAGVAGADGQAGVPGQNGVDGQIGPAGPPGTAGADGADGSDGSDGNDGAQGVQGNPGARGERGEAGQDGADGDPGPAGNDGQNGSQGIQGIAGNQGIQGAAGEGVPTGGNNDQILAKASDTDFDTEWVNAPSGGGSVPTGTGLQGIFRKTGNALNGVSILGNYEGNIPVVFTNSSSLFTLPAGSYILKGYVEHVLDTDATYTWQQDGVNVGIIGNTDDSAGSNAPHVAIAHVTSTGGEGYRFMRTSGAEVDVTFEIQSAVGEQGSRGVAGTDGNDGVDGQQGIQGVAGSIGPQGIQGQAGAAGTPGVNGQDGVDGAPGSQGIPGVAGQDGDDGTDGQDGSIGPQGIQGIQGEAGNDGTDGTNGTDGADGEGLAAGGATGQILSKQSSADFDTNWINPPSGGGGSVSLTGDGGEFGVPFEEGTALSSIGGNDADGYQWSLGNGKTTTNNGMVMPFDAIINAVGIVKQGATIADQSATVVVYVNGVETLARTFIDGNQRDYLHSAFDPVLVHAGDVVRLRTTEASWTGSSDGATVTVGFRTNGVTGDDGAQGWTPNLSITIAGERRILRLTGFSNGEGDEPALPFTPLTFLGVNGYVDNETNAVDIRGIAGPAGIQGVPGIQGEKGDKGDPGDAGAGGSLPAGGERRRVLTKLTDADDDYNWEDVTVNENTSYALSPDFEGDQTNVTNAEALIDGNPETEAIFNVTAIEGSNATIGTRVTKGTGHKVTIPINGYDQTAHVGDAEFNISINLRRNGTVVKNILTRAYDYNVPFDIPNVVYNTLANDEFDEIRIEAEPLAFGGTGPTNVRLRIGSVSIETTLGFAINKLNIPKTGYLTFNRVIGNIGASVNGVDHAGRLLVINESENIPDITVSGPEGNMLRLKKGKLYNVTYAVGQAANDKIRAELRHTTLSGSAASEVGAWETSIASRHSDLNIKVIFTTVDLLESDEDEILTVRVYHITPGAVSTNAYSTQDTIMKVEVYG